MGTTVSSYHSRSSSGIANDELEYGQGNEGTGLTGSHHHTGVDPRIDSGRGDPRIDSGRGEL